jgi:hypothetical protein
MLYPQLKDEHSNVHSAAEARNASPKLQTPAQTQSQVLFRHRRYALPTTDYDDIGHQLKRTPFLRFAARR